MKITVIGKKHSDFTDDKGVRKQFWKLYATHKVPYDDEISTYEGEACSELSLPEEIYELVKVGCKYSADYDRNGKLLEFEEL